MLAYLLFIISLIVFLFFFYILGKEWYAPYTLYCVPFILIMVIGAVNQDFWGYTLGFETFVVFFFNIFFFLFGCALATKIYLKKRITISCQKTFSINNWKLTIIFCIIAFTFIYFYKILLDYGTQNGMSLTETINYVMVLSKFESDVVTIHKPIILKFLILFVEIMPYVLSYWIARRLILKDGTSLILLLACFIGCLCFLFLNGSRGPLVECFVAFGIAIGIIYFQKTNKKMFPLKIIIPIGIGVSVLAISFFAILPYMGRTDTANTLIDSIYQYLGSQIHNFDYWVTNKLTYSTGFLANTLSAFYEDINTFFNIDVYKNFSKVSLFFVTSKTGHDMGNVFTCLFSYYADGGLIGVILFTFISGFISEKVYLGIKSENGLTNISFPVYLLIGVSLIFSFFGSRFYVYIVNLKIIIKLIYVIVLYFFISNSGITIQYVKEEVE